MKIANKQLLGKFKESLLSILPIFIIVLLLGVTVAPLSFYEIITFCISSLFLVFGLFLFTNGAESSMLLMGESIGSSLARQDEFLFLF